MNTPVRDVAASEAAHGIARGLRRIEGVVDVRDWLSYQPAGAGGFDVLARFPVD